MVDYTFISQQNSDGRSRRKTNRKACERCRIRKRRCNHQRDDHTFVTSPSGAGFVGVSGVNINNVGIDGFRSQNNPPSEATAAYNINVSGSSQHQRGPGQLETSSPLQDTQQCEVREAENDSVPRFVGDLNPEARLLDKTESHTAEQVTSPDRIGVWVQPRSYSTTKSITTPISNQTQHTWQRRSTGSNLIASEHVAGLSDLFFTKVHPILPLLNEEEYRSLLAENKLPMALAYSVCLIMAKDSAAGPYLHFYDSNETSVPVRAFCTKLHASVMTLIARPSGLRRITLLRILALLSLHHEGPDGGEQASAHHAQACHHAQTLALHVARPNDDDNLEMKKIFWCLWIMDRLNAATNSRPCIFNDIDIGAEQPEPGEAGSAAFDICFCIAKSLSRVIALYRPTNPDTVTGIDLEHTAFEQVVEQMQGWHLPAPTLATLRIFFLATTILAFRLKTIKALPTATPARLRQQLAAIQIIRQMQDRESSNLLRPLPVVVYGVSLAMSVSYQQLRYSKLVVDQQEALQDFKTSCDILQTLQRKWSSADAMATLAQKVSIELEKVSNLSILQVERGGLHRVEIDEPDRSLHNAGPYEPQRSGQEDHENDQICDIPGSDQHGFIWDPKVSDLFGGMDDMSWMYLAVENPMNLDSLPYLEMWDEPIEQFMPPT